MLKICDAFCIVRLFSLEFEHHFCQGIYCPACEGTIKKRISILLSCDRAS